VTDLPGFLSGRAREAAEAARELPVSLTLVCPRPSCSELNPIGAEVCVTCFTPLFPKWARRRANEGAG
jgi:hypothetical protein